MANKKNSLSDKAVKKASGGYVKPNSFAVHDGETKKVVATFGDEKVAGEYDEGYHSGKKAGKGDKGFRDGYNKALSDNGIGPDSWIL